MNPFEIIWGNSPIVAAAIHDGHYIRQEVRGFMNLSDHERMREEDPYTAYLAEISSTRLLVHTSRFEVDVNRSREMAIYRSPADAWGLTVWGKGLPHEIAQRSLDLYDRFYGEAMALIMAVIARFGYFVVLDLHTYNHKRRDIWHSDPAVLNPEINVATATIPERWWALKNSFVGSLKRLQVNSRKLDVRENIKFKGGEFPAWINREFGRFGCAITIEVKKTFMEEWTGRVDIHHINALKAAIASTIPRLAVHFELVTHERTG